MRHPAYGTQRRDLALSRGGERFTVTIHLAAAGMTVEVLGTAPLGPPAAVTPTASAPGPAPAVYIPPAPRGGTVLDRARIREASASARNLGDLVRRAVPSLEQRFPDNAVGNTPCLEFRGAQVRSLRAGNAADMCNHPLVYMDGVTLQDPALVYGMTSFQAVEWIQALSPAEAGARYGAAPDGVIVIATPGGVARVASLGGPSAAFLLPSRRHTFARSQDGNGHPFVRAAAGAAVGNLLGLVAGVAVGRECIYVDDRTKEIEKTCGRLGVVGVGTAAFALPALGSALGAHFGGRTDASVGRMVPALIGAGMMIFPRVRVRPHHRRGGRGHVEPGGQDHAGRGHSAARDPRRSDVPQAQGASPPAGDDTRAGRRRISTGDDPSRPPIRTGIHLPCAAPPPS